MHLIYSRDTYFENHWGPELFKTYLQFTQKNVKLSKVEENK